MTQLALDRSAHRAAPALSTQVLDGVGAVTSEFGPVWIIEEVAGHLRSNSKTREPATLRLYRLDGDVLSSPHELGLDQEGSRVDLVMTLLARAKANIGVLVCSHRTASAMQLAARLEADAVRLNYVLEIDASRRLAFARAREGERDVTPRERAKTASWQPVTLSRPAGNSECFAANLGKAKLGEVEDLTCFALSIGGIQGDNRGTLTGVTSLNLDETLKKLAQLLAWTRWIRLAVRRANRQRQVPTSSTSVLADEARSKPTGIDISFRANRRTAEGRDKRDAQQRSLLPDHPLNLRRRLTQEKKILNVVELFAGAGGMGLGFLGAHGSDGRGYRITGSAEIQPIYTQTLRQNHAYMQATGLVQPGSTPAEYAPMDLCSRQVRERLESMARTQGDVDVLIGGPPCQGFSSANRNSWSSSNPNNRLVDAFLDCVEHMAPKVLLMENVQGILWTPRDESSSDLSVAAHVLERLGDMGYQVFPKLLDAVWYGAPQNRNRFFLLGIHRDLGYSSEEFGAWGPFPKPTHGPGTGKAFVTVRDAIADLPKLGNGDDIDERPYASDEDRLSQNAFLQAMRAGARADVIWDHVTSRHADYVIERYKAIPQGKNWEAARELMTNYADVERTHSNIYRRLAWSEPAITIGHYRKSMLIHPSQHRGLSLREAARLQSFPDWFRFAGTPTGTAGGLMHKQQQLANAVCPSVTKAVAEFILDL
ncbi:hypothetical protein LMG28688_01758 [Paraburkholderia caffeinitolerans]|uniref:Cytosine-specific methyltransferase n=1 Tax=Paraburkholderia caffeinitolerans TaxID=1723730 RepID=A0A6J5FP19_9BURK|nr:DNA cytosine methyltransferase [Paraburkholderia caffeinitolerans]CAB3783996.1 hypothetical protein LMG28688_01758 [Paraburkholderia caffeinitolerans]